MVAVVVGGTVGPDGDGGAVSRDGHCTPKQVAGSLPVEVRPESSPGFRRHIVLIDARVALLPIMPGSPCDDPPAVSRKRHGGPQTVVQRHPVDVIPELLPVPTTPRVREHANVSGVLQ